MEEHTNSVDYNKPLPDSNQEQIAKALAAHLRVDRPDADYSDLIYAARKLITDQEENESYEE